MFLAGHPLPSYQTTHHWAGQLEPQGIQLSTPQDEQVFEGQRIPSVGKNVGIQAFIVIKECSHALTPKFCLYHTSYLG